MPRLLALLALLAATPAFALEAENFNPAANDLPQLVGMAHDDQLEELATLLDTQPMAVANTLERDPGGRRAIARYVEAMLDAGQADRLATQTVLVLRSGNPNALIHEALGMAEEQDGGTWFPRAEEAGYFLGGVAATVARHPQRDRFVTALAERLRLDSLPTGESLDDWLVASATGADGDRLGGAARQWFDKGFNSASR